VSARPRPIVVTDDPIAGPTEPVAEQPPAHEMQRVSMESGREPTTVIFARVPESVAWALESTAAAASAADRRRGKVSRQEAVSALIWSLSQVSNPAAELAGLIDRYRLR
jgi:hypothetical protein